MRKRLPRFIVVSNLARGFRNWLVCGFLAALSYYFHVNVTMRWITRKGTTIQTAPGDASGWWGIYEVFCADSYGLQQGLLAEMPQGFLDIGANIGAFSLAMAERFPGIRGTAFEPGAVAFATLKQNLAANAKAANVRAFNSAVVGSAPAGTVTFYERSGHSGESSLVAPATGAQPKRVTAVALADAMKNAGFPIDLLKVDIEGGEYALFDGTPPELLMSVKTLILEYHNVSGRQPDELLEKAAQAGLRLRHREGDESGCGLMWLCRS